jgi:hypothetical protein
MTRKDHQAIADAIKSEYEIYSGFASSDEALRNIIHRIANVFAADNPRFNRQHFYTACGITRSTS